MNSYAKKARLWLKHRGRLVRSLMLTEDSYRPIFVCGLMGSGTTIVSRLLDQEFEIAGVANESARNAERSSPIHSRPSHAFGSPAEFLTALLLPEPLTERQVQRVRRDLLRYYRSKVGPLDGDLKYVVDKAPNAHLMRTSGLGRAFPQGTFLLLFRDPRGAVEGLRRKWSVFSNATLDDTCKFWCQVHERFMSDVENHMDRVVALPYEMLCEDPERALDRLERAVGLRRRDVPKTMSDRADTEGFGLRNVVGGRIEVRPAPNQKALDRLSPDDLERIEELCGPTYRTMSDRFIHH